MSTENFFQSKTFKGIILGIGGLAILILVFSLGVAVGTERASFSFRWADQYHRNFGGPQGGFFGDFMGIDNDFTNSNGSFGQIISVGTGSLTVKDRQNTEKIFLVNSQTSIIYQRKNIKFSDLKVNENVVVIGDPNSSGQIQAELIRVIPPLPVTNNQIHTPQPNPPTYTLPQSGPTPEGHPAQPQ